MNINDQIGVCLIIIFIVVILVGGKMIMSDFPIDIKNKEQINYVVYNTNTQIYKEGMTSPRVDKIINLQQLYNYLYEFQNEQIDKMLEKYDNEYFSKKGLIVVTIQEESTEVTNTLSKVEKLKSNDIEITIERKRPESVIYDNSMNHFVIEVEKETIVNAPQILVEVKKIRYI